MTASSILRTRDWDAGWPTGLSVAARLLALAGGGISLYTAWLGGKLVEEMGESVKPAMERMSAEEKGEVESEGHGRELLDPASPLGATL